MQVTQEDIQKAKELLGLVKASSKDETEGKSKEEMEKAKAEYKDAMCKAKEWMEKADAAKAALVSMGAVDGDDSEILANKKKAEDIELQKAKDEEIKKAKELEVANEGNELIKGLSSKLDAITLLYSQEKKENEDLKKSLTDLATKVDEIGKISNQPKSIITKSHTDRFTPTGNAQDGEVTMSLQRDKKPLISKLKDISGIMKGGDFDQMFAKAASDIEICGALGSTAEEVQRIASRLKKEHKIIITA